MKELLFFIITLIVGANVLSGVMFKLVPGFVTKSGGLYFYIYTAVMFIVALTPAIIKLFRKKPAEAVKNCAEENKKKPYMVKFILGILYSGVVILALAHNNLVVLSPFYLIVMILIGMVNANA